MLTVVSDSADRDGSGAARSAASSVIDELVREGARRMLAEALRAEVEAYIAQFADVRDEKGHRLVVRNGRHAGFTTDGNSSNSGTWYNKGIPTNAWNTVVVERELVDQ